MSTLILRELLQAANKRSATPSIYRLMKAPEGIQGPPVVAYSKWEARRKFASLMGYKPCQVSVAFAVPILLEQGTTK